jgi:TPR repeat protein
VGLYRNGCLRGDAASCRDLGAMQLLGRGVEQNHAQALTNFRAACDAGHARACFDAGRMMEAGLGTSENFPQARVDG